MFLKAMSLSRSGTQISLRFFNRNRYRYCELLISEARVTAVLRKDQCADHWPELVSQRQAQGIEICFYDEKGDSVGLAEDIILIHIASGLINIQDLDVVRNTASLVFSALHEMVAESVGKRDLLEGKPIFAVSKRYERSPVVRARAIARMAVVAACAD